MQEERLFPPSLYTEYTYVNIGFRIFITCAMICFRGLHVSFQKQKLISKAYNIGAYGKHADLFNSTLNEREDKYS